MPASYADDWDDVDVFGVLDGVTSPDALSYPQFIALANAVGTRLGLDTASTARLFNLGDDGGHTGDGQVSPRGGTAAAALVNPPLCAHLAREGAAALLRSPASAPTVVCHAPGEGPREPTDAVCHHGAPHVHCLYCLRRAADARGPPRAPCSELVAEPVVVTELRHGWVEHYQRFRQRSQKLQEMLSGDRVAYVGDPDDEYDLDTDEGTAACEAAASEDARHCCFLLSAGTTARPLLLAYCAACHQFAPLTRFSWVGRPATAVDGLLESEGELGLGADSSPCTSLEEGWEKWVATDDGLTVMAKLLLACHLHQEGMQQRVRILRLTTPSTHVADALVGEATGPASGPRWVFMYRPALFDFDTEDELITLFEDGAQCTHGSAILPAARVVGAPPDPKLLLLHEEQAYVAPLQRAASMSPPYHYEEVVEGFLVDFGTADFARDKVALVLQHDNHYHVTVRLVYVEDTGAWESALVVFHLREEEEEGCRAYAHQIYTDPLDPTQSIRVKRDYTIDTPLPPVLWAEYIEATREADHDEAPHPTVTVTAASTGAQSSRAAKGTQHDGGMDGLPFSLQSRTLSFLASMTCIAQVLAEVMSGSAGSHRA